MSPLSQETLRDPISELEQISNAPQATMLISRQMAPAVLVTGLPWPPGVRPVGVWPTRDMDFVVLMRGAGLPGDGVALSMIVRRRDDGFVCFVAWQL